jgi:hypothetical protein
MVDTVVRIIGGPSLALTVATENPVPLELVQPTPVAVTVSPGRGPPGEQGPPGDQGIQGIQGVKGDTGPPGGIDTDGTLDGGNF